MDRKLIMGAAALATCVSATPALSQYYPYPAQPQGGVAGEIQRGVGAAAQAIGAIANVVRGSAEQIAVTACTFRAQRYGNVTVTEVYPKGQHSLRVKGFTNPAPLYGGATYSRDYARRSFTCTVRQDGKVTKFKTKKVRY